MNGSIGVTPVVSILMAVYNGGAFLTEALDDILGQTLQDFELIVVEDGSTDETPSVLERYAERDPRIMVISNGTNLGLAVSLNRGLERCRAPLVARFDADDRYRRDRLERQVAFMNEHPAVGLLASGFRRTDPAGRVLSTVVPPTKDRHLRLRCLFMNSFIHSGVVFRTDLVRSAGGYDESYWTAQDSELWSRLLPLTGVANLPEPLVDYRIHDASIVQRRGDRGRELSLSVPRRLLSEYLGRPLGAEETRAIVDLYQGFSVLALEDVRVGLAGLREAVERARCREAPDAVRFLKREMARSLLKQFILHAGVGFSRRRSLLIQALRWEPRFVLRDGLARAARRSLPPFLLNGLDTIRKRQEKGIGR